MFTKVVLIREILFGRKFRSTLPGIDKKDERNQTAAYS